MGQKVTHKHYLLQSIQVFPHMATGAQCGLLW